jgi:arginine N-succinyltransferase
MPKYPIYVNLLSKEAQKVINKVHDKTVPALRLLEAEGFARKGYVDIFDGGPTVEANRDSIRTIVDSQKHQVIIGDVDEQNNFIVCNTKVKEFRATQTNISVRETANQVVISQAVAEALLVSEGDWVRIVAN